MTRQLEEEKINTRAEKAENQSLNKRLLEFHQKAMDVVRVGPSEALQECIRDLEREKISHSDTRQQLNYTEKVLEAANKKVIDESQLNVCLHLFTDGRISGGNCSTSTEKQRITW